MNSLNKYIKEMEEKWIGKLTPDKTEIVKVYVDIRGPGCGMSRVEDEYGNIFSMDELNENECEYCRHDMQGKNIEDRFAIDGLVDDSLLYNWCECGRHTIYEINFCPMCGRKLKEDEHGE